MQNGHPVTQNGKIVRESPGNLPYMLIPQRTTTEINSIVLPAGSVALVWDKTLGVLKIWNGLSWKVYITSN